MVKPLDPPINSPVYELGCDMTADGLTAVFMTGRPGTGGSKDLQWVRRESISSPWSSPMNLGASVNTDHDETDPDVSADGTYLVFTCNDG